MGKRGAVNRRTGVWLVCAALAASAISAPAVAASITVVASSEDQLPGGTGTFGVLKVPVIKSNGRLGFSSDIVEKGEATRTAVFTASLTDGVVEVIRGEDPSPDGNGNLPRAFSEGGELIDASGRIAFLLALRDTSNGTEFAVLAGDSLTTSVVVRPGDAISPSVSVLRVGPNFSSNGLCGLSDAGHLSTGGGIETAEDFGPEAILAIAPNPANSRLIVAEGQTVASGNTVSNAFVDCGMNDAGQVAVTLRELPEQSESIYVGSETGLVEIVSAGDQLLGDGSTVGPIIARSPINDSGQLAFAVQLEGTPGGASDNEALFLASGTDVVTLVRRGDPAPDGNGSFLTFEETLDIDENGRVIFQAQMTGAADNATRGLFEADGSGVRQIIRSNGAAPSGGVFDIDVLGNWDVFVGGAVAEGVAFRAFVDHDENDLTPARDGLYFYDGEQIQVIVEQGDDIGAFTAVTDFALATGQRPMIGIEGDAISEEGEVVFRFTSDDQFHIAIWSPDAVTDLIFGNGFEVDAGPDS